MSGNQTLTAHFVIGNPGAEYPMHGVYGGVTPAGTISASFYAERQAIPQELDMTLAVPDGADLSGRFVAVEGERRGKQGLLRTVTATYHMDADMAESIGNWMLEKARELRTMRGA